MTPPFELRRLPVDSDAVRDEGALQVLADRPRRARLQHGQQVTGILSESFLPGLLARDDELRARVPFK